MKISAVVLAKNEEKNIESCLKTLQFCDEIIVVDDESVDTTSSLAKKCGAVVYQHALANNFSQQRNFGLKKAKNDWVLFVDADERVSTSLRDEIIKYANSPINRATGFLLRRKDTLWGRVLEHGETGNIKLLRFAKKETGKWNGNVHEVWEVSGDIRELKNPLLHFPHQTLSEFLQEINFYTTLRSQELFQKKIRVSLWQIVFYPKAKFVQNYFFRLGLLDGTAGIVFALCMSLHSFLVRGKLWQLWQVR